MTRADLLEEQRRLRSELLDPEAIRRRQEEARKGHHGRTTFNGQSWHRGKPRPRYEEPKGAA